MNKTLERLTPKLRLFVERYHGDAADAFRYSGSNGSDAFCKQEGEKLLQHPLIIEAIEERDKYQAQTSNAIADRKERQAFWTSLMRNQDPHYVPQINPITNAPVPREPLPLMARIKGSELLGKSETDFVEKVDMTMQHSLSDIIMQSHQIPSADDMSVEEIERIHMENRKLKKPDIEVQATPSEHGTDWGDFT